MSDLSATNCGNRCGCNNNSCMWIIIILILASCCGGGDGFGFEGFFGGRDGCCDNGFDGIWFIIIILLIFSNGF